MGEAVDRLIALSQVKGYTRKTKSGKVVRVGGYTNRITKKALQSAVTPHAVKSDLPPMYLDLAEPSMRVAIKQEAEKLFKDNPGLSKLVPSITVMPFERGNPAGDELEREGAFSDGPNVDAILGFSSMTDGSLWLNANTFGSREKAAAGIAIQRSMAKDWTSVPVTTPEELARYTMTHEIGHSAATAPTEDGFQRLVEETLEEHGIIQTKGHDAIQIDTDALRENVSAYATTSQDEFAAEAWAEFNLSPNPRPIAKEIGQALRNVVVLGKPMRGPRVPVVRVYDGDEDGYYGSGYEEDPYDVGYIVIYPGPVDIPPVVVWKWRRTDGTDKK